MCLRRLCLFYERGRCTQRVGVHKRVKEILKEVEAEGGSWEFSRSGHIRVYPPPQAEAERPFYMFPASPSSQRVIRQLESMKRKMIPSR